MFNRGISPHFADFLRRGGRTTVKEYKVLLLKLMNEEVDSELLTELAEEGWRVQTFSDSGVILMERNVDPPTSEETPE